VTQLVLMLIGRGVMNGCHAKSSEGGPWGVVYHLLNRSVGRMHTFRKATDFEAFERVVVEAHQREPIRILAYCLLSNHRHFVVWPERDGQLSHFVRWLVEFG
jgi:putative transposase